VQKYLTSKNSLTNSEENWNRENSINFDTINDSEKSSIEIIQTHDNFQPSSLKNRKKLVKKVADLVTKNKKLQNSNKNSFEQSYKLKKFIEESGNEVISDLKVQSKFIENARFMDNNRFCKNERMNTENSLVMTPLYNDIRKNKYKSKIGITQYMAGTPNIESFSKRARIFSATNNGNKEN